MTKLTDDQIKDAMAALTDAVAYYKAEPFAQSMLHQPSPEISYVTERQSAGHISMKIFAKGEGAGQELVFSMSASKGHVAFSKGFDYFVVNGELRRARTMNYIEPETGYRVGSIFVCHGHMIVAHMTDIVG